MSCTDILSLPAGMIITCGGHLISEVDSEKQYRK